MKKFPLRRQHDSMQCGVACLQMVCAYYGLEVAAGDVERLCHATVDGVSLKGISDAAEELGLRTVSGRMSLDELGNIQLPCILHWNQNHFVVLYRVRRGRYYVADPGRGRICYSREEFARHWLSTCQDGKDLGIVMLIEKPSELAVRSEGLGVKSDGGHFGFRFLLGYIRQYRKYFVHIALGLLLGSLLQLVLPFLTQAIVDVGIKQKDIGFIWLVLIGQLVLTVSRTMVGFIRSWLLLHISMRINISLLSDFFIKLMRLPMAFFDTKLMGDLMQRMGDHGRVEHFITSQTLSLTFSMVSFVVFGVVLLVYNWLVFVAFMAGSLLYGAWMTIFLSRRKVLDYELFERQAINSNKTYELLTSMQEIKLQGCECRRRWEWEDVQADLFGVQMKSLKLQQMQEAGSVLLNETKNIVVTVIAAAAVIHGSMTLGMMLAVQYIIGQLNGPVEQLMGMLYSLQDVRISLDRIGEIHQMEEEGKAPLSAPEGAAKVQSSMLNAQSSRKQGIMFYSVSFKYDYHNPRYTVEDICINIPHGKVTAIVGASGSGKTTLVKLMLGFYPVNKGTLTIDGCGISTMNLREWRSRCGVVMQDGVIFSESIARNIAVDDGEIDTERLERAAEMACIRDFVMSLPLKFNTKIGRDGVGLSQGQKQRILIARAVYKQPEFIFLDEATNSLDATNERMIVEHLEEFYRGRTVVVVAHRLSTVRDADQIVVLDHGRVAETGTHDNLTAKRGVYYRLVRNQLELGK
ncbi:MAG: peptidase domain-containing ABC transporter [Prevotella sp.]|nr:peptidase domain-containing ABC transporter [Prevotella sp.]